MAEENKAGTPAPAAGTSGSQAGPTPTGTAPASSTPVATGSGDGSASTDDASSTPAAATGVAAPAPGVVPPNPADPNAPEQSATPATRSEPSEYRAANPEAVVEDAENPRFVIIDGVQVNRARAIREGLLTTETGEKSEGGPAPITSGPSNSRARGSRSAKRG